MAQLALTSRWKWLLLSAALLATGQALCMALPGADKRGGAAVDAAVNAPPRGIFVSSGPRLDDALLSRKFVDGNLIRVAWRDIEPVPGQYHFAPIEALLAQARRLHKQVTLSVLCGPRSPDWLYAQGAAAFAFTFRNFYSGQGGASERMPLPWDPVYLQAWTKLVAALGQRFDGDPALALVHITHASKNGFEMQLPEQPPNLGRESPERGPWQQAGYRQELHIAALKQVVDAFMTAFPRHRLDIEIHPVLSSLTPATEIYRYGRATYGERFGLFSAWWSGMEQPWNRELTRLFERACVETFCTVQLIGNQTRQPRRLAEGSARRSMEIAFDKGARYFEVWDIDLRNEKLASEMQSLSARLR